MFVSEMKQCHFLLSSSDCERLLDSKMLVEGLSERCDSFRRMKRNLNQVFMDAISLYIRRNI